MFEISQVECIDLGRSSYPLSTGIGFLDHMLDQLNSHAQIGVAITLQQQSPHHPNHNSNETKDHVNRHAQCDQGILQDQVGTALGTHLKSLLDNKAHVVPGATSRFCCPLDEALVECTLTRTTTTPTSSSQFQLAPYGEFPSTTGGRRHIGYMETQHVETFFKALAQSSGIEISLCKIRGRNGHHIVESAFKAFSRALRNLIDGSTTTTTTITTTSSSTTAKDLTTTTTAAPPPPHKTEQLWGRTSESYQQSKALQRTGKVERTTKETSILVHLTLNGGSNGNGSETPPTNSSPTPGMETGIGSLNEFYHYMATEAQMELILHCQGDVWVDDHHTSEDVSIAVGQVLHQALGTKAGLNRMWCATATYGSAVVEVTMDLSNRPCLTHNLSLSESGEEYVTPTATSSTSDSSRTGGQWSVEMMEHALESLVMNALMTVHVVEHTPGTTVYETTMATAQAFGKALYFCAAVDPRRAGKTASSKGTLSV